MHFLDIAAMILLSLESIGAFIGVIRESASESTDPTPFTRLINLVILIFSIGAAFHVLNHFIAAVYP